MPLLFGENVHVTYSPNKLLEEEGVRVGVRGWAGMARDSRNKAYSARALLQCWRILMISTLATNLPTSCGHPRMQSQLPT
jgi:hypothetical protein